MIPPEPTHRRRPWRQFPDLLRPRCSPLAGVLTAAVGMLSLTASARAAGPLDLADRVSRQFPAGHTRYVADPSFRSAMALHWESSGAAHLYYLRESGLAASIGTGPAVEQVLSTLPRPVSPQTERLRRPTSEAGLLMQQCLQGVLKLEDAEQVHDIALCRVVAGRSTSVVSGIHEDGEVRICVDGRTEPITGRISPRILEQGPVAARLEQELQSAADHLAVARQFCLGDRGTALVKDDAGAAAGVVLVRMREASLTKLLPVPPAADGFHRYPASGLLRQAEFDAAVSNHLPSDAESLCAAVVGALSDPLLRRRRDPLFWLLKSP